MENGMDINSRSPGNIIPEIIMLLASGEDIRCFALLEGESDLKFYRKFLKEPDCQKIDCKGRDNVIKTIERLNENNLCPAFGIIDDDFDRLIEGSLNKDNIIVGDVNDVEGLLLKSAALDRYLNEKVAATTQKQFLDAHGFNNIFNWLTSTAAIFGRCRLINKKLDLQISFIDKPLAFSVWKYINESSLNVKANEFYHDFSAAGNIEIEIFTQYLAQTDSFLPIDLTQGHDALNILAIAFRVCLKPDTEGKFTADAICSDLRLAFRESDFLTTQVYQAIVNWAVSKQINIFNDELMVQQNANA